MLSLEKKFNQGAYKSYNLALCFTVIFNQIFQRLFQISKCQMKIHTTATIEERKSQNYFDHMKLPMVSLSQSGFLIGWTIQSAMPIRHQFEVPFYVRCVRRLRTIKCVFERISFKVLLMLALCHFTITSLRSFDTNFIIESNYWFIQLINST